VFLTSLSMALADAGQIFLSYSLRKCIKICLFFLTKTSIFYQIHILFTINFLTSVIFSVFLFILRGARKLDTYFLQELLIHR
jgi:hypothetical protein